MKDSYELFLKKFKIEPDDFLKYGVEGVMMIDKQIARKKWDELVKTIEGGGITYIRKYGRTGEATQLYFDMYKVLFPDLIVKKDHSNKSPKKSLFELLNVGEVKNYQASHVFGHTCNVFCFMAPWNIVLMPKIYDPLTGHEAKGNLRDKFIAILRKRIFSEFGDMIIEYNHSMEKYAPVISNHFESLVPQSSDDKNIKKELAQIERFKQSILKNFKLIKEEE